MLTMPKTFTNPIYAVYQEAEIVGYYQSASHAQKVAKSLLKQDQIEKKYDILTKSTKLEPNHLYLDVHSDNTYQFMMTDPFCSLSPITEAFFTSQLNTNPIIRQLPVTIALSTQIKEIEVQ